MSRWWSFSPISYWYHSCDCGSYCDHRYAADLIRKTFAAVVIWFIIEIPKFYNNNFLVILLFCSKGIDRYILARVGLLVMKIRKQVKNILEGVNSILRKCAAEAIMDHSTRRLDPFTKYIHQRRKYDRSSSYTCMCIKLFQNNWIEPQILNNLLEQTDYNLSISVDKNNNFFLLGYSKHDLMAS